MQRIVALLLLFGCLASSSCKRPANPSLISEGNSPSVRDSDGQSNQGIVAQSRVVESQRDAIPSEVEIEELLRRGELKKATKAAQARLMVNPNEPQSIFWLARSMAAQNRFSEAIRLLADIPENESDAKLAAIGQSAEWYEQLGQWDEASKRYQELLEVAPDANFVRRRLARILNRQGRRLEAAQQLNFLCRRGDIEEEELRSLITLSYAFSGEKNGDFAPIGVLGEARAEFSNRKLPEAAKLLEPFQAKADPAIHALYGRVLLALQDLDAARQWENRTVAGATEQADYWLARGMLAMLDGRFNQAVVWLGESIVRDPTNKTSYLKYSEALSRVGQPEAAKLAFNRSELVRKTAIVGNDLANDKRDLPRIQELCSLLRQMDRPFEALSWEGVAITYYPEKPTQEQANQIVSKLNQQRLKLLKDDFQIAEQTLLCGFSISQLKDKFGNDDKVIVSALPTAPVTDSLDKPLVAKLHDIADDVGLVHQYDFTNASVPDSSSIAQEVGAGVAVIDFDLDGLPDAYFPQAAATPMAKDGFKPNVLYRNLHNRFVNATAGSGSDDRGFGQGACAGDINQDGFPDLVVANIGENQLFINNGDGTFNSKTLESCSVTRDSSTPRSYWTTNIAIGDVSGDAIPDIVEVNYIDDSTAFESHLGPARYVHAIDRLFVSDARDRFLAVELGESAVDGLGVILTDLDGDLHNDIYVGNDGMANQLWQHRSAELDQLFSLASTEVPVTAFGDHEIRVLVECARPKGCAVNSEGAIVASMGIACGDFNADSTIDLLVTNFYDEPNMLLMQTEAHTFVDSTSRFGMYEPSLKMLGFGTQAIDVDNDSRPDIAVLNGHVIKPIDPNVPFQMPPQLYRTQSDGRFSVQKVIDETGYWTKPVLGRGLASLDWNQDGKTDLLAVHLDVPVALVENRTDEKYAWLQMRLVGTRSERDAIGARVTVTTDAVSQVKTVNSGDGYCCKNEMLLTFGLNEASSAEVRVAWPSGQTIEFTVSDLRKRLLVVEGDDQPYVESLFAHSDEGR